MIKTNYENKRRNLIKVILLLIVLAAISLSASAAGKFNIPLNWVLGPTGTSVDNDNDGFLDTSFIGDDWVNLTGDTMTGSLIGLNLNMTYGNFSKGMIVLGNVGIGKTSPNYKLDVLGSINATNINATGIIQATTFIGSGSSLTGINTDFTNNSDINVTRFVANNTLFVNDSRVGIGTASPDTLLHIQDTSSGTLGVGAVLLKVEAISNGYSSAIEMKARQNDGTQKSMFFEYNAQQNGITIQNNSGSRLVHFDNDGNVGIGTVAPVQKLTVDGGQIIVGDATFSTTASSSGLGNSLIIGADTGGGHTWIQAKSAGNNYITFSTTPDGGTTAEYMRITKTGDICDQGNDADLSDCASDIRLKENINSYGYGLDEVLQLNPVEFNWNEAAVQEWGYTPNITILGLVAQEVEEVIPEWVVDNSYGYKKVDGAGNLKYLLVKAVQELNTKHEQKDTEISELKQQNQALKQAVCELNPTAEICQ